MIRTVQSGGKSIEYVEVTLDDIALANTLAHEVLGRSLDDLPPQTRRVLGLIETYVAEQVQLQDLPRRDVRFTRRELRGRCGMSDAAIRVHLERLVAMEYVRTTAGRNGQRFEYELSFDGDLNASAPQMIGLIDIEALRVVTTTATSQGPKPHLAPRLQGTRTDLVGTSRSESRCETLGEMATDGDIDAVTSETTRTGSAAINGHSHSAVSRAPVLSSLLAADRESLNAAAGVA